MSQQGIVEAMGLLFDRLNRWPAIRRWSVLAVAGMVAGIVQTFADDVWLRLLSLTIMPSWQVWAVSWQPERLFLVLVVVLIARMGWDILRA